MEFLENHPILAVFVIGSFVGTIISYIAPYFTRDCLCADEDFRIGNLGLHVFIHDGWGHYVGNLFFLIPGALLCESFYNKSIVMTACILFAIVTGLICMPLKKAVCGSSGVAYLLCSIACMHGLHWWGFLIFIALFVSSVITDHDSGTSVLEHVCGFAYGGLVGLLLNL